MNNQTSDSPQGKVKSRMVRPALLAVLVACSLFFSVFFLASPRAFSQKNFDGFTQLKSPETVASGAVQAAKIKRYDFKLGWDDTFYRVISYFEVPGPRIQAMLAKARNIYDLRTVKKDSVLRVYAEDNKIESIEYRFNEFEAVHLKRDEKDPDGFSAYKSTLPHETRVEAVAGTIYTSLYEDGRKAGLDPQAILSFSDIFAWDVDFAADIRRGDSFKIYFETLYVEGRFVKTGKILGAEMVNEGKTYRAVYFEDARGRGGYYDENGKSVRRMLLKSPLRYSRISSRFTNARFHPILKYYRPHHGIDYAAPHGTPVEASGSGRVVYSGWKGGYGNFVEVRHPNGYITGYGHLSKIKSGISVGAQVEQGEIIGYVGSTGISTGPHLHYEVKQNNMLINPLRIKAEPNKAVPKEDGARFASVKEDVFKRLAAALDGSKIRLASIR